VALHRVSDGYITISLVALSACSSVLRTVEMQLVVVCCREMEDRCHMINALDRYRVKVGPVDESDIKSYLQQHFTVANVAGSGTGMKPASFLDPERLLKHTASSSFCLTCLFKNKVT